MPKEYKEIKLFNGMAMSNDANDINDDVCQLTINTKDIANGKIESEQAPTSSLLNSMTISSAKVKEINDLKRISDNVGNGICIFNLKNVSDATIVAKGGITNNNLANSALTEIVNATGFSNKAKFVKFGKQARISNTAKVPYFIGYVNQQGKTSLVAEQNNNTLIVEEDVLPSIASFSGEATTVCVSIINPNIIFFTNRRSGSFSIVSLVDIGTAGASIKAMTVLNSDLIFDEDGATYEIKAVTQDKENSTVANRQLYVIAEEKKTTGSRVFKIAMINQVSLLANANIGNSFENLKKNGFVVKVCTQAFDEWQLPRNEFDFSGIKVTNAYIYFSFCNIIKDVTLNNISLKDLTMKSVKHFDNEYGQFQAVQHELLYRISKSFSDGGYNTYVASLLPVAPTIFHSTNYDGVSVDGWANLNVFMDSGFNENVAGARASAHNVAVALETFFRNNKPAICAGMPEGTYYYYYPVPNTGVLRGVDRFATTGYNNLNILDYSSNLVGIVFSGCINGALLEDHNVASDVWSTSPPSTWNPVKSANGWFCFKFVKTSVGISVDLQTTGVPRAKWDYEKPTTFINPQNNQYFIRHANNYMLIWNGENAGSESVLSLPPIIPYTGSQDIPVSASNLSISVEGTNYALSTFKYRLFRNLVGQSSVRAMIVFESDATTDNGDIKGYIKCLGNIYATQEVGGSILSMGKKIKITYPDTLYLSDHQSVNVTVEGDAGYELPLKYSAYINDEYQVSERSEVTLENALDDHSFLIYKRPFQYANINRNIMRSIDGGCDYAVVSGKNSLITSRGLPLVQAVLKESSLNTFNGTTVLTSYTAGTASYVSFGSSAFLSLYLVPKNYSDESQGVVYEEGFNYQFKMSFIYDGYQESVLSAVSKNFFADQSYSVIEMTVVLHPAFLTKTSKRLTGICLYVAKYSGDSQVELFRLIKEFSLTGDDFNLANKEAFFVDNGNRYGSYEANTGLSERTLSVSLLYSISHLYNGTLYVADINHSTTPINQKEYIICKSQPGKLSVFDYANDFAVLPFIPKVITSFNYKIYVFGDEAFAILDPNTLAIELSSNVMSCSDPDHVCSTPFGLFVYRNKRVYSVIDNNVNCISLQIERADSQSYSGLDNLTVKKLYFDNNMNSLCVLGTVISNKGSYFQAGKPIIFALSFDTKSWKIVSPMPSLASYTAETISEYNVDGKQYLLGYAPGTTNVTSYKLANDTLQAESLYVSKKIPIFSEFLSGFLYSVKLNFYKLSLNAVVTVKGYKDNAVAFTLTFTQNADPDLSNFKEMANTGNTDKKINYIVVEIYGKFKDVQSIGLLTRGLIR